MSSNPSVHSRLIEQTRKEINQLVEEIVQLTESTLAPAEFYQEFARRVQAAMAAPAVAVWSRAPDGRLTLAYQIGLHRAGLDQQGPAKESHERLLHAAAQQSRPFLIPPHSGGATQDAGAPANLTDFIVLVAPVLLENQVLGLVEVLQEADRSPEAQRGYLKFLVQMAGHVTTYLRNHQLRQITGQQQLWLQLEAYARLIHSSLKTRQVAYYVVNEGKKLIEADRVAVGSRLGKAVRVDAVSGVDVIEKRSSLVVAMHRLMEQVLAWGERLTYSGTRDESVPPAVINALDQYLAESGSKVLVVMPLPDGRDEKEAAPRRPRTALLAESFQPTASLESLLARLDVVARHAGPAMYNALEYERIPARWIWLPLAKIKDGIRGKTLAQAGAILATCVLLALALVFVPYPLKLSAKGQLLPEQRQIVYPQVAGRILQVKVTHGQPVQRGQELLVLHDLDLEQEIAGLNTRIAGLKKQLDVYDERLAQATAESERQQLRAERIKIEQELEMVTVRRDLKLKQSGRASESPVLAPISGVVVTFDLSELVGKTVKPGERLMQVARLEGPWYVEIHIPENHAGQVRRALATLGEPLRVDFLLTTDPDRKYTGWLYRNGLAGEATVHDNVTVVKARVEIPDVGRDVLDRTPVGAELRAKIHCGRHALGYVWFYELWEFIYERLIF